MSVTFNETQREQIIKAYNELLQVCNYTFNDVLIIRGTDPNSDPETKSYNTYNAKFIKNPKLLSDALAKKITEFYETKRKYFLNNITYSDKWISVETTIHQVGSDKVSFRLNFSAAYRRALDHSVFVLDKPGKLEEKENDVCLPDNILICLVNTFIKCEIVKATSSKDDEKEESSKLLKRLITYSKELESAKRNKYNDLLEKHSKPKDGEDHVDSLLDGFVMNNLKKVAPGINTAQFKSQFNDARKNNPTFKMLMDTYGEVTTGKVTGPGGLVKVIDKVGDIFQTAKDEVIKIANAENENANNTNQQVEEKVEVEVEVEEKTE